MKVGDLVVLINHKESDWQADPPKRVMMTGLITRPTICTPMKNRYERGEILFQAGKSCVSLG